MSLFVKFTDVIYILSAGWKGEEFRAVDGTSVGIVRRVLQASFWPLFVVVISFINKTGLMIQAVIHFTGYESV